MEDENKRNVHYFEAGTTRELYVALNDWQEAHQKRFLSLSVENDSGHYCCIALTNPTEVVIVDGTFVSGGVDVTGKALKVYT